MSTIPPNLSLTELMARFATEKAAREYLEGSRWPNGPVCPHCGNKDEKPIYRIAANPTKGIRAGLRQCAECAGTFTVTVGTIFERSKTSLNRWLIAWYLLCSSKKGVSALQIQRILEIKTYRSAWFMMHRIRYALRDPIFAERLGEVGGPVEVNETYVGSWPRKGKVNVKFDEAIQRALSVKPPPEGWAEHERRLKQQKKRQIQYCS